MRGGKPWDECTESATSSTPPWVIKEGRLVRKVKRLSHAVAVFLAIDAGRLLLSQGGLRDDRLGFFPLGARVGGLLLLQLTGQVGARGKTAFLRVFFFVSFCMSALLFYLFWRLAAGALSLEKTIELRKSCELSTVCGPLGPDVASGQALCLADAGIGFDDSQYAFGGSLLDGMSSAKDACKPVLGGLMSCTMDHSRLDEFVSGPSPIDGYWYFGDKWRWFQEAKEQPDESVFTEALRFRDKTDGKELEVQCRVDKVRIEKLDAQTKHMGSWSYLGLLLVATALTLAEAMTLILAAWHGRNLHEHLIWRLSLCGLPAHLSQAAMYSSRTRPLRMQTQLEMQNFSCE